MLLAANFGDAKAQEIIERQYSKESLADAYFQLGEKYFDQKEFQTAILYYSNVLYSYPESCASLLQRGKSYLKIKDKENACVDIEKAMNLNNENAQRLYKNQCK
ncbi:MAG: tetratricopeptide repeat protein [Bacteroidales bacterium]|nr:tetratricopeptide repeat protein [Bacteroidales bacterium]MCF8454579.1 tetratricopeptide repeat protein [Bacteroidales bacterium]